MTQNGTISSFSRGSDFEQAYASPQLFPSTSNIPGFSEPGKLGPDFRRRRAFHSSSDPDHPVRSADGFINEGLRAGGPNLCRLPIDPEPLRVDHPLFQELCIPFSEEMRRVKEILAEWGVEFTSITAVMQTWGLQQGVGGGLPTLSILAVPAQQQASHRWVGCAREIHGYLMGVLPSVPENYPDGDNDDSLAYLQRHILRVEIVCPDVHGRGMLHDCKSSDALELAWTDLFQAIMDRIGFENIMAVCHYRVGESEDPDKCAPTVVVSVRNTSDICWKSTREDIVGLLDQMKLEDVAVLIRKDFDVAIPYISIPGTPTETE